ncbi:MAG TPA: CPBP family intramembrane metalloprotease [Nitrospirales bacterium]|nr:CPBP family intramembrane metalloprotease [Nitrospirales bacterium]
MPLPVLCSEDSPPHAPPRLKPWRHAWSAVLIVGCFYVVQALGIFMVSAVGGAVETLAGGIDVGAQFGTVPQYKEVWLLPLSLCVGTLGAMMVSIDLARRRAVLSSNANGFSELLGKSYDFRNLWRFVLMGLALGFGFVAFTEYGGLPADDLPQPLFDAMISAPPSLQTLWALMIVGVFPVVEEVLFRGILFTGMSESWGPGLAGFMTTMIFVGVHMPKVLEYWPALLAVSLVGSLTILLRIRTESLVPGIALHGTYNGVLVMVAFLTQATS